MLHHLSLSLGVSLLSLFFLLQLTSTDALTKATSSSHSKTTSGSSSTTRAESTRLDPESPFGSLSIDIVDPEAIEHALPRSVVALPAPFKQPKPGYVRFPFSVDQKANRFAGQDLYNPIPDAKLVQVPGPYFDGMPNTGVPVYPSLIDVTPPSSDSRLSFLELSSSSTTQQHQQRKQHASSSTFARLRGRSRAATATDTQTHTHHHRRSTAGTGGRLRFLSQSHRSGVKGKEKPDFIGPATWVLPTAPFADPFTKEEDPILNFNPYNPYTRHGHWTRRNVPPGQERSYEGPIIPVPPGSPEALGVAVGPNMLN